MKVSIIICSRNRASNLGQTLDSLDTVDVPDGLLTETLIVDNGSTDNTAEVVRRHGGSAMAAQYVLELKPGLSNARNAGLANSKGDVVVFTDDDLRFPKSWLETLCGPIAQNKGEAVAGNVELAPHLIRPWMTPLHRSWLASTDQLGPVSPDHMVGANMAFARSVLKTVPAFDPELGAGALGCGEETLFSHQLRKAGLRICRSQGSPVVHCFDEKRLARSSWLQATKAFGESDAYLDYHWSHRSMSFGRLLLYRKLARYYLLRLLKWRDCASTEGAPIWELLCMKGIHWQARYLVESQRPRNYEREGLIKIRGVAASTNRPTLNETSLCATAL